LEQAGAAVEDVAIYQTLPPPSLPPAVVAAIDADRIDLITFTSASTARNLHNLLAPDLREKVRQIPKLSIGPMTTQALVSLGWDTQVTEASQHDIPGMIAALRRP
jgi:uroporphyrinogen III methyltransferase/synthase